jgi:hypothetical protein
LLGNRNFLLVSGLLAKPVTLFGQFADLKDSQKALSRAYRDPSPFSGKQKFFPI